MKKEVAFSDTPLFIPDLCVNVSQDEAEQILQNMTDQLERIPNECKEAVFLEQNVAKLTEILQTEQTSYDLYFEIVTNSYGKLEFQRHEMYKMVMHREVLYIY